MIGQQLAAWEQELDRENFVENKGGDLDKNRQKPLYKQRGPKYYLSPEKEVFRSDLGRFNWGVRKRECKA